MEFLSEMFIKYWKEVVVAVMSMLTLPFIRRYVRKQRAKMFKFFREKEQLKQSFLDEEKKRIEAEELLENERKIREELERKLQAEKEKTSKAHNNIDSMRVLFKQEREMREILEHKLREAEAGIVVLLALLEQECKAHEETKRKLLVTEAELQQERKAHEETKRKLLETEAELQQERKAYEETKRKLLETVAELQQAKAKILWSLFEQQRNALEQKQQMLKELEEQKGYQAYQTVKKMFS